nr:TrpB-like pyridoxal phosphate-dependent enzyme [Kibdelosporangium sp. MJ126-NF4]CTQ98717.1 Tryptophan synthase beta chain like (EC 4.2.1.20) [Kibdelosporangium sp. MJ126-NF4]
MTLPQAWYNALPDLDLDLPPDVSGARGTRSGISVPAALIRQEMSRKRWLPIPDEVLARYRQWRPTPLRRALAFEQSLGTRCRIYYKYEGGNLSGSHKLNTAVAQAFYYRAAGAERLTVGTGAGQWGTAVAAACSMFGLGCGVHMVRSSYEAKPYRRTMMELLGASVQASPSASTSVGRAAIDQDGTDQDGSLSVALAEALVDADQDGSYFCTGSGETYSLLHQTVIGLEAKDQLAEFGDTADVVIASLGGGSNFGGLALPFLGAAARGERSVRCVSVEPAACPKLTRGRYAYDYTDASKQTPLQKMYTLGHTFAPPSLHAGGLRYHATSKLVSALRHHGMIEAVAYPQRAVFASALRFAATEGVLPAPESAHAIHGALVEAMRADEAGQPRCIVVGVSGHGYFDLAAYQAFHDGTMADTEPSDDQIAQSLARLPCQPGQPQPAVPSPAEQVRRWAERQPHDIAVIDDDGRSTRTWTWCELSTEADRLASVLVGLGVRPDEPVGLRLPNRGESAVAALAVLRAGAACCLLQPSLGIPETTQMLRRAGIRVLVVAPDDEHRAAWGPAVEHVITVNETSTADARLPSLADRLGQLAFTSGTTGQPKPVLHKASTLTLAARAVVDRLGITAADRVFVPCPIAHHSGFLYGMVLAWTAGCAQIYQGRWDARRAIEVLDRHGATFAQVAPPMVVDMLTEAELGARPPESLRACVVTGAPVPDALAARATEELGLTICRAWGSTETCMGTLSDPADSLSTTDGQPLTGVRIRIVGPDGTRANAGTEGIIEVRGPCLFPGHGLGPEFDRSAFTADGWYRTGDLGVLDDNGRLRVTGRLGDVVNRGGQKVPVTMIEGLLAGHGSVADVAITGVFDARLGERACAFVVLRPGARLTLADIRHYLDARGVTRHYWPERLEVIDRLPRNEAGKVRKPALRRSVDHLALLGEETGSNAR